MAIEDFLYEEVKECDSDFDFYIVYNQHECEDHYYPPYKDSIGIYKSKENAIKRARESFYKMAKGCTSAEDRKYRGVDGMLYIEGGYFEDGEVDGDGGEGEKDENGKAKNKNRKGMGSESERQVYIIYDKEEQEKINARHERMNNMIG